MITDIDDHTVFIDALELHYIDMNAFVKTINQTGGIGKGETQEAMLAKRLVVITEKDIKNKTIIKNICEDEEAIGMAVFELVRMSEDKVTRQAYQRRQDEIMLYNKRISDYKHIAEQERHRADTAESALAEKDVIIAQLKAQLAEK